MRQRSAVLAGLFLLLVGGLVLMPPTTDRQVPLTVYSGEPNGGKALRLWLEALGRRVTTLEGDRYTIGQNVGVVLVLSPSQTPGAEALGTLERWTRQGGRLIVATDSYQTWELLRRFDVSVRPLSGVDRAVPAAPGLLDPAIEALSVETRLEVILGERATGGVPLLLGERADGAETPPVTGPATPAPPGQRPILAARVPAERGELIVLTAPGVFSNAGLHDEAHARLALSLIGPDARGEIAFDELHHGFGQIRHRTLFSLLLEQAWGRAVFLAGGVVLLFLLLRGRRFGRAVPVFVDRGRSLGELVTSQASLYRAGGKRAFVADHLARQLRHDLAQAVGLPADATDEQISVRAAAMGRDPTRALRVLTAAGTPRSDRELLALVRDGEAARADLTGGLRAPLSGNAPHPNPSPARGRGGAEISRFHT